MINNVEMDIHVTVDTREVDRLLRGMEKQIPFTTSVAINKTAENIRDEIIKTLPNKFTLRTSWWKPRTRYGFNVKPSNKRYLTAEVYTRAPWMISHEYGEIRRPRGTAFAVPTENVKRTKKQLISKAQKPRALQYAFIVQSRKGAVLAQRIRGALRVMYGLEKQAPIKATLGFAATANRVANKLLMRNIEDAVEYAMRTAK